MLLRTLSAAEFFVTLARSVPCTILSLSSSGSSFDLMILICSDMHCELLRSYIDRCVAFLIKSNQYNQTQLDSNEGVEPSQG